MINTVDLQNFYCLSHTDPHIKDILSTLPWASYLNFTRFCKVVKVPLH